MMVVLFMAFYLTQFELNKLTKSVDGVLLCSN